MHNEEILNLAKKQQERNMEYENKSIIKTEAMAGHIGALICIVFILINLFVKKAVSYELITVVFTVFSINTINEAKLYDKKPDLFLGIICSVIAAFFLLMYVWELVA